MYISAQTIIVILWQVKELEYNVYCDESSHLENDRINVMSLGAIYCPKDKRKEINQLIIDIKNKHGVLDNSEIKWSKIGPQKLSLYSEIIDLFFKDDDLHFRGLLVPDKSILDHERFSQTHDDWYYKMYFDMLKVIFSPLDSYNIYLDIKDTHSYNNTQRLHDVCCNSSYDFSAQMIKKIQPIRSQEVQIMQIVDILTGALAYTSRLFPEDHSFSSTKLYLIDKIQEYSGYDLQHTTLYRENKFNILVWESKK